MTQDKDNNEAASALTLELRNIAEITRPSDQTLHLRFMSCRACSAFHHAINEAAFCTPSGIEAASAPDLIARIVDRDTPPDGRNDVVDHDLRGNPITRGDVEAVSKAASASQSSTPVPRVGGPDEAKSESSDLAHVARQRQESEAAKQDGIEAAELQTLLIDEFECYRPTYPAGIMAWARAALLDNSPHRMRKVAAVAEGVDAVELPDPLDEVRAKFRGEMDYAEPGENYYNIAQLQSYGAQQREAGRRERDQDFGLLKLTLEQTQERLRQAEEYIAEHQSAGLRAAMDSAAARQPVSEEPIDFVQALAIAQSVFDRYKEDQPKWWAKLDGTPILNDIAVRMAEAFRDEPDSTAPPAKAEGMIYHVIDDSGADDCRVASYASVSEAEQGRLKIARSSPNERFAITKTGGGIIRRPMNLEELQRAEKRQRVIAFSCNLRAQFPNDPENQCDKWCGCEETCTASFAAPVAILAQQAKGASKP